MPAALRPARNARRSTKAASGVVRLAGISHALRRMTCTANSSRSRYGGDRECFSVSALFGVSEPDVTPSRREGGIFGSDLLDLAEFEIDRGGAAEDRHCDLDARAGLVDFLDDAVERSEGSVGHPHVFADLEPDRRLRPLDPVGNLALDPIGLMVGDRHRLLVGAEKAGHFGGVLDE